MTTAQQSADIEIPRDVTDVAELRRLAQEFVRTYIDTNGKEPTGELVGRKFGMSERWGRKMVDAVRSAADGTAPARRSGTAAARHAGTSGTPGRTVADAVAEAAAVAATPAGTPSSVRAVFGPDPAAGAPAQSAARQSAPPARNGTPAGSGAARSTPVGAPAPARRTGTARTRPTGVTGTAEASAGHGTDGGFVVAWLGFAFGALISIAANVMDARIPKPPDGVDAAHWVAPVDWAPSIPAQFGAAVWPIALLLSVEVLSRVSWPEGWSWLLARYGGVGAVGLFSAIISYGHIHDVLIAWGYASYAAAVGPLEVDGLMVVSGFALLAISQAARGDQS